MCDNEGDEKSVVAAKVREDNMATKSDKEGSSGDSGEVCAEWIVSAKLKITQPKKKAASFGTGDCGAKRSTGSPCRVVYKWNSVEKSQEREKVRKFEEEFEEFFEEKNQKHHFDFSPSNDSCNFLLTHSHRKRKSKKAEMKNDFSQESGSKSSPTQDSKNNNEPEVCRSTCNIILTTDMCPAAMLEKSKGKDGCTTHTYTFSPDQVGSRR